MAMAMVGQMAVARVAAARGAGKEATAAMAAMAVQLVV